MKLHYNKIALSLFAVFTIQTTLTNIGLDTKVDFNVSNLGNNAYVANMQIQDSENILALVAAAHGSQIISYNSAGLINNNFGNHGVIQIPYEGNSINQSMITDEQKKILIGGFCPGQEQLIKVSRFNADGIIDETFGSAGIASAYLPGVGSISKMQIKNGSLVIAGSCNIAGIHYGMLAKFTSSGQLDKSFGKDGIVIFDTLPGSYFDALQIDKRGRLFIAGHFYDESYIKLCLICFKKDGAIDSSFAEQGIMENGIKSQQIVQVNSLHMLANNKLLVSGQLDNSAFIACYNSRGKVVKSFAKDGTLLVNFDQRPTLRAAVLDRNESLMIVGSTKQHAFILKIISQGLLDRDFGDNGVFTESLGKGTHFLSAALPDKGKLLIGGIASKKPLMMQYHLDHSFVQFNLKNSHIVTDLKSISGSASIPNAILKLTIDDNYLEDTTTDQDGNWHVELTGPLVNGSHTLRVALIARNELLATAELSVVVKAEDCILIDGPIHETVNSDAFIISGKSSRAHAHIPIFIDGIYKHTVYSDAHGKWESLKIEHLLPGDHIISAQLVDHKSAILASAGSCITAI